MAKKGSMFVEIEGGAKLRRAIRRAADVDLKELSAANRRAAQTVAARARQTAPIGDSTGGHINTTVRPGGTSTAGVVRVGNKSKPYAGVVHYGTPASRVELPTGFKPNPWVIKAAQDTESQWLNAYYKELKEIIERIG